jgi:hypothetical protein
VLRQLAGEKHRRKLGWPRDWRPHGIPDPRRGDGGSFTDDSAWEYISELLVAHPIRQIILRQPDGAIGYVMIVEVGAKRPLYIKVQLGSNTIIGRSFHYSTPK